MKFTYVGSSCYRQEDDGRIWAAHHGDISDEQPRDGYDPRCGMCFLGYAHTIDHHAKSVVEAISRGHVDKWS